MSALLFRSIDIELSVALVYVYFTLSPSIKPLLSNHSYASNVGKETGSNPMT